MKAITLTLSLSLAAAGALFLTQCSSSSNGGTTTADCPSDPPTIGTECSLPNGTQCRAYAASQSLEKCSGPYVCDNGTWTGSSTSDAAFACPITPPVDGTTCSVPTSCGGGAPSITCSYGCDQGGPKNANCVGGKWSVTAAESFAPCLSDGADAGTEDSGTSDGGDAG